MLFAQDYKEFAKIMKYETKYETALQKATKEHKNLMILVISDYCPWCERFEKKTLSDKNIDKRIKSKFTPLILNKEEKNMPKYLNAPMVPALFFVDSKTQKVYQSNLGFLEKNELIELLDMAE
jgi:thioredoxin-related protein